MNQFLVLKHPGKVIFDAKKVEVVKILSAESVEDAKDEFLIWLKHNDLVESTDYYFLSGTELYCRLEDVGYLLKLRRDFRDVRRKPVC